MKNVSTKQSTFAIVAGALLLVFGLLLSFSAQPAAASPLLQTGYPIDTPTFTATFTSTPTVTATVGAGTVTATVTATRSGTLAPPRTGTPTQLVPVTGADLTQRPDQSAVGFWIALWLVGLLLIGFGLRSRLGRR